MGLLLLFLLRGVGVGCVICKYFCAWSVPPFSHPYCPLKRGKQLSLCLGFWSIPVCLIPALARHFSLIFILVFFLIKRYQYEMKPFKNLFCNVLFSPAGWSLSLQDTFIYTLYTEHIICKWMTSEEEFNCWNFSRFCFFVFFFKLGVFLKWRASQFLFVSRSSG